MKPKEKKNSRKNTDPVLLKIFKNRKQILEGLKNNILRNEYIEKIAKSRMEICEKCPHIDRKGSLCAVPFTQPCCGKCGCSLSLKTRSLSSSCGDEENPRWAPIISVEEEDQINSEIDKLK